MTLDPTTLLLFLLTTNLILSLVVGWAAGQRGRDSTGWFFLSVCISPVLALLVLMAAGDSRKKTATADYLAWKRTQPAHAPTTFATPLQLLSAAKAETPSILKTTVWRAAAESGGR